MNRTVGSFFGSDVPFVRPCGDVFIAAGPVGIALAGPVAIDGVFIVKGVFGVTLAVLPGVLGLTPLDILVSAADGLGGEATQKVYRGSSDAVASLLSIIRSEMKVSMGNFGPMIVAPR